jgi:hypothetical protein
VTIKIRMSSGSIPARRIKDRGFSIEFEVLSLVAAPCAWNARFEVPRFRI